MAARPDVRHRHSQRGGSMKQFMGALDVAAVLSLGVVACGGDDSGGGGGGKTTTTSSGGTGARAQPPSGIKMADSVGEGEGELKLVNWAGYAEDGSTDPKVDWVTDFEKE